MIGSLCRSKFVLKSFEQRTPFRITKRYVRPYTPPKIPHEDIALWIEENLNKQVVDVDVIGTSSWSSQYCYVARDEAYNKVKFFVKTAPSSSLEMFHSEEKGMNALHNTKQVVVPEVKHIGTTKNGMAFLVSEYLNMSAGVSHEQLGKCIAMMHLAEPEDEMAKKGYFGFSVDNTIGGTPQENGWMENWVDFFRERRLRYQLRLAGDPNLMRLGDELCSNLELFFEGIEIRPSILHGDLWAGNYAACDGQPAIFDPATYYGHHEAEFGMSWCGSFKSSFWKAYHEIIPKAKGFEERHLIYTLYHYLNHYNLFGSGYYYQCQSILTTLTRDVLKDA